MYHYELSGLHVASTLALPNLAQWVGSERSADVVIRLNEGDPPQDYPIDISFLLKCSQSRRLRLTIPSVAQYHVCGGNEISIFSERDTDPSDIRAFLLNAVLALLVHQRGLLPLYATTIRMHGMTAAFVGRPASGKSTLAAALMRRGHEVLSDDITIVDPTAPEPLVLPSIPTIKLWRDALEALNIPIDGLRKNRDAHEKYVYPTVRSQIDADVPVRLDRIYMLNNAGSTIQATVKAREELSLSALVSFIASPSVATLFGTASTMIKMALGMFMDLRIHELCYHIDYKNVDTGVAAIEEALLA
jgi:hypothetical protein